MNCDIKLYVRGGGKIDVNPCTSLIVQERQTEEFMLPKLISDITGQTTVPFGDAVISTRDTTFGTETCAELFGLQSPHTSMALDGVEIFTNSSGSHHELKKLQHKVHLIRNATDKVCVFDGSNSETIGILSHQNNIFWPLRILKYLPSIHNTPTHTPIQPPTNPSIH